MSRRFSLVPIAAILALALLTTPAAADDLDKLLNRPVSPGAVGLLVSHANDPRVEARWRESLRDASPQVRATAARMLLVNAATDAIPDLARMVETDADPGAALEAARALLVLSAGPADVLVLAAAKRLNDERLSRAVAESKSAPSPSGQPGYRTVIDLPQGYVADVLKLTNCDPPRAIALAAVGVRYSEVCHLKEIQWIAVPLTSGCEEAARAILTAGLLPAPAWVKTGDRSVIVLPMNRPFLQCLASSNQSTEPLRVGQNGIAPPRKTRQVNPEFPGGAPAGPHPIAILSATISGSGCVEQVRVTRSSSTAIDAESIRAISQWEFAPTIVNGAPTPVSMTITMQFSLPN